jgi:Tfp pilus assembly protein PilF
VTTAHFGTEPSGRLFLPALQAYCREKRVAVSFKRHDDIFTITADEIRCRYLSDQSSPLDPRLIFPLANGVAYLTPDSLKPLGDTGEFRIQDIQKDGHLSVAMRSLDWPRFLAEMAEIIGPDAVMWVPNGTLGETLLAYQVCGADAIEQANAEKRPGETLGAALVRRGSVHLEAVLDVLIGPAFLYRPHHQGPLALCRGLLEAGKITPDQAMAAIEAEARHGKPIRQTLVELRACRIPDLDAFTLPTTVLPPADQPGHRLIRLGLLTESDLLHYLLQSAKQERDLLGLLVEEGRVSREAAHEAQRRHDLKRAFREEGRVRLGEILVMRGRISQDTVLAAILEQLHRPNHVPLGTLLVEGGRVSPEDLAEALRTQDERLDALVEKELKDPGDPLAGSAKFRRAAVAAPGKARKRRHPLPRGAVGIAAGGLLVVASLGYIAYSQGPGKVVTATPSPDPLSFLKARAAGGEDKFQTIAEVQRSVKKGGEGDGDLPDLDNPAVEDEFEDLEGFVEQQQAEAAKLKKAAAIAGALTGRRGGGGAAGGSLSDAERLATSMGANASRDRRGAGAAGGNLSGAGAAGGNLSDDERLAPSMGANASRDRRGAGAAGGNFSDVEAAEGTHNAQALIDVANGSYADARKSLKEALKLNPDNPVTLFNLGLCDYHLKEYPKADASFARARTLLDAGSRNLTRMAGPELARRLPATGSAPAESARPLAPVATREEALRSLIRISALYADVATYQGHVADAQKKPADAKRRFAEALPAYRRRAAAQTALADLKRDRGDQRGAMADYAEAARMDPRYPEPWEALAELAAAQGQNALAVRYRGIYQRLASR